MPDRIPQAARRRAAGSPRDGGLPRFRAYVLHVLAAALLGALAAVAGTVVHRGGGEWNVPWGLALAFLIVGLSTWNARVKAGILGLGVHMVAFGLVAYALAGQGPGGDVIVPVGGVSLRTFLSQHAGYTWLAGAVVVQLAIMLMPARWFRLPPPPKPEEIEAHRRRRRAISDFLGFTDPAPEEASASEKDSAPAADDPRGTKGKASR